MLLEALDRGLGEVDPVRGEEPEVGHVLEDQDLHAVIDLLALLLVHRLPALLEGGVDLGHAPGVPVLPLGRVEGPEEGGVRIGVARGGVHGHVEVVGEPPLDPDGVLHVLDLHRDADALEVVGNDGRPRDHGGEGGDDGALDGEAGGDAGIGHELLRLVQIGLVVAHPLLFGQLPLLHGRGGGRGQPAEAGRGHAQDLAPVHRPGDGLAHAHVLERTAGGVDVEVVVAEPRAAVAHQRLLFLEQVVVLVVLDEGVLDLARAERGHDVGLVGNHPQDHVVHVGLALLEVVGIFLEDELLLDLPVHEHEGAGADGRLVEIAVLLDPRLADDVAPEAAEGGQEAREGLLGDELDAVLARGLDLVHGDEVRLAGRALEEAVEGELHVGRGHLLPVVELDALPELEGPGVRVGADLPGLRQLRPRVHVGVVAHELAVHEGRAPAARERGHELGIEARRLGGLGGDEGAPGLGRLGGRGRAESERAQGEAARLEKVAPSEGVWGRGLACGSHAFFLLWPVTTGHWDRGCRGGRRRSG